MSIKIKQKDYPVDAQPAKADIPNYTEMNEALKAWGKKNPPTLSRWGRRKDRGER